MTEASINRTVFKLGVIAVGMFGFGYALVPLYNAYCELTGRGDVTGISSTQAEAMLATDDRLVTVVFDTNVRDIPWRFTAVEQQLKVNPGKMSEAIFTVRNNSDQPVVGRAIPSVSPSQAGIYFNKTECFCFQEQLLQPGETREMAVRFIVDTDLPERFSSLTLSYTFFNLNQEQNRVSQQIRPVAGTKKSS